MYVIKPVEILNINIFIISPDINAYETSNNNMWITIAITTKMYFIRLFLI